MVLARPKACPELQPPINGSTEQRPPRQPSTLHCGYVVAEHGATAALSYTDSAGELAHGELLDCECGRDVDSGGEAELCEDILEATTRVRSTKHLLGVVRLYALQLCPFDCA